MATKTFEELNYGRLTVIGEPFLKPVGTKGRKATHVECRCSCGVVKAYALVNLKRGVTQSCGCLMRERSSECNTKHGHARVAKKSREYSSWRSMINRCTNPKSIDYPRYGGRGIKVCDRWLKFENFLEDMGRRPEGMTIDRKNVDGDYVHDNCYWATQKEQSNNRRSNRFITAFGKTQTLAQWAEEVQIPKKRLQQRLNKLSQSLIQ